jgi:Tfp pilus assembly protein PilZ
VSQAPSPAKGEKRRHQRKPVELQVTIQDASQRTQAQLRVSTADLGVGGLFVKSDLLLEIGEEVMVALDLPNGTRISCRARVIHTQRDRAGMGLAFQQLAEPHRDAIQAFLDKH